VRDKYKELILKCRITEEKSEFIESI